MTYSSDLIDSEVSNTSFIAPPAYPSVFGITFSPIVSGACVAVVGLGIAGYLFTSSIQPQFNKNQELETKLAQTQEQIQQRKDNAQKIAAAEQNLERANARKQLVTGLFASDKKLDTLLLDLSKLVNVRQGQLQTFEPEAPAAGSTGSSGAVVVNDSSFGAALNNKIKRKGVRIQLQGNFEQIQSILRTIERLDQLLIIKDFRADVDFSKEKILVDSNGTVTPQSEPTIKTSFKIQALIPLTPAEQAAATPPPPAKK
jgi:type IV pilus assembly protein PilO